MLHGTEGSIKAEIFNPWYHKMAQVTCYNEKSKGRYQPLDNRANCFQLQLEGFIEHIIDDEPQIGTTAPEGLTGLRTLLAINESSKQGVSFEVEKISGQLE